MTLVADALATETIRRLDDLTAIAPAWWDLWARTGATPFQSPAWLLGWWDTFAPGALAVVAVHRGQRLVGLAPFWHEDGRHGRRLLPLGLGGSDYLDVLVDPDEPDAAAQLAAALAAEAGWTECEWPDLPPGAAALALPCPAGCTDAVEPAAPCPVLRLPATPDELRDVLPYRKRRAIQLARNRAARRGTVRIEEASEPAQALHRLDDLIRLHQARWRQKGEPGVFADPRVRRFHEAALPALLAAGLVRVWALTIDGVAASVLYELAGARARYAYLAGFETAFAHESPGTLLFAHAIEEAVRAGAAAYHFLRGDETYKFGWGAVVRTNSRRVFRR